MNKINQFPVIYFNVEGSTDQKLPIFKHILKKYETQKRNRHNFLFTKVVKAICGDWGGVKKEHAPGFNQIQGGDSF